ncbi:MAG: hypothetical protein H6526_02455 [Actinobacteria bacterium]|nr:hypothetical protein [Actinomycetota bacterium]
MAKLPTIAALRLPQSRRGQPLLYPDNSPEPGRGLPRMTSAASRSRNTDPVITRDGSAAASACRDHEQNCFTSTVRPVGSSHANLRVRVGWSQRTVRSPCTAGPISSAEMLEQIRDSMDPSTTSSCG